MTLDKGTTCCGQRVVGAGMTTSRGKSDGNFSACKTPKRFLKADKRLLDVADNGGHGMTATSCAALWSALVLAIPTTQNNDNASTIQKTI